MSLVWRKNNLLTKWLNFWGFSRPEPETIKLFEEVIQMSPYFNCISSQLLLPSGGGGKTIRFTFKCNQNAIKNPFSEKQTFRRVAINFFWGEDRNWWIEKKIFLPTLQDCQSDLQLAPYWKWKTAYTANRAQSELYHALYRAYRKKMTRLIVCIACDLLFSAYSG